MPTEKGMYLLDLDASVVSISGILHQEQEWNGRTSLCPIAYGSKVLSDTEMKYGAPKAEKFAVDLLLRSNLVQQEFSRMNINSLSLLDRTQVMRMMARMVVKRSGQR